MTRQEFIFTLYDNGNGLTFNQIEKIEIQIKDGLPEFLVDDIMRISAEDGEPISENIATARAMMNGYDVYIDSLGDCLDMLELRDLLRESHINPTDNQVYRLWYVVQREV